MKPSPNRNRQIGTRESGQLANACPPQLPQIGCAQKELNLQPAGYKGHSYGRVIAFPLRKPVAEPDAGAPTEPETGCGNRNRTVTEQEPVPAPSHKSFALSKRPDILGFCEAVVLAAALGGSRGWR